MRVVGDVARLAASAGGGSEGLAEMREVLFIPAVKLGSLDGFETTVVALHNRHTGVWQAHGASPF